MKPAGTRKRATLSDVAELSGMSTTAVSLVLNNRPGSRLSEEARERIIKAAAELGYRPNQAARSLRVGKTATVGVLSDDVTVTRYASAMIRGALDVAEDFDHTVLIAETGSDPKKMAKAAEVMVDRQPDGVVIALMGSKEIDVPKALAGLPVVVLNGRSTEDHPSVLRDERTAGYEVANHLIGLGHRRIALIGDDHALRSDPRLSVSIGDRFEGLEQAMSDAGLDFVARGFYNDWEPEAGYEGLAELLDKGISFTALVALNDRIAFGVYQLALERGISIPDELSVVSFDDEVISTYVRPSLTTARIPYELMGRRAMHMLLSGAEDSHHEFVRMPLQIRGSATRVTEAT
jgi:LacI family transcriptional regulator